MNTGPLTTAAQTNRRIAALIEIATAPRGIGFPEWASRELGLCPNGFPFSEAFRVIVMRAPGVWRRRRG